MFVGQMFVGQMFVGQMFVGQMSVGQISVEQQLTLAKFLLAKCLSTKWFLMKRNGTILNKKPPSGFEVTTFRITDLQHKNELCDFWSKNISPT
jgi:hypothetical protein